ncbi:MAG: hypothetical protein K6T66_05335 [Peptococcaceae bacterium]|nr:hypothetical protein [Peptococcaceae bacterium]
MTARDNKQKVTDNCPKQEENVKESSNPCEAVPCDAGDDAGCAECE